MSQNINKVVVDGEVKIDLTSDTVDPEHMLYGYTAHDRTGSSIVGSIEDKSINNVVIDGATLIVPSGCYSKGLRIELKDWLWDPFRFASSIITNATGLSNIEEEG